MSAQLCICTKRHKKHFFTLAKISFYILTNIHACSYFNGRQMVYGYSEGWHHAFDLSCMESYFRTDAHISVLD